MKQTNTVPVISIILPVYNAEAYLRETLDSILRQTFRDFECFVVNDGSKDESAAICDEYAARDHRLIVIHQKNKGLVRTLNDTIAQAEGRYIARIDADDPSFEDRLDRQFELLESNPEVVLVGGGFEIIDENGYFIETIHTPTRDEDIRRTMMLRNPFGHAGVMFRKDAFEKTEGYSDQYGPTEDLRLWIQLSKQGLLANISRPVYRYRIVTSGISQSSGDTQSLYTQQHIHSLWAEQTPRLLSRREVFVQAKRYLNSPARSSYCLGLKEQFLQDNAQIGVKLIRMGHVKAGVRQLLAVALVGRSGIKAVKKRVKHLDIGSFKQLKGDRS